MKRTIILSIWFAIIGMAALATANPAMLPQHPGYPSGGDFANDTGQRNLTHEQSLADAAVAGGLNLEQKFETSDSTRVLEHQNTEGMPIVGGSDVNTQPPVTESTRTPRK